MQHSPGGIKGRWLVNSLSFVLVILAVVVILISVGVSGYYYATVRDNLEAAGCTFLSAEREMVPTTTTEVSDPETLAKVRKLIDWLEDYDDSQNVFHDAELPEEEEEE